MIFDVATDNDNLIYKSTRMKKKQPQEKNYWYYTLSRLNFKNNEVSYHFHFSNNKRNFHVQLMYDDYII